MEVNKKADKNIRCVHRKTGEVVYNNAVYAKDKGWQKRTGYYPRPEPKAEEFKPVTEVKPETAVKAEATTEAPKDLSKETKKETNVKQETVKNG